MLLQHEDVKKKTGFGRQCALQKVLRERTQAIVVNETLVIQSTKNDEVHFYSYASYFSYGCLCVFLVFSLDSYVYQFTVKR